MIARLAPARTRRAFSAAEFAALGAAGVFAGHPAAAWTADDVYRADDGAPYLFSVEQYHRMIAAARLHEDERVELIHGEIVHNMPIGDPHMACVKRFNTILNYRAAGRSLPSVGDPVELADSEPQPDFMLLAPMADFYASRKPRPADAYLVVEVADTSLDYDLGDKAHLYAENGVAEYWVVDLQSEQVHVHRGARADGSWAAATVHARGETLAVAALAGVAVSVDELLP